MILALDQGTTSSRSILFDREGNSVVKSQRQFPQHYPHPGWVEHDPEEIWSSQVETIREALSNAQTQPLAIGITNQRETTLIWDRKTGKPIAPAIVWQDRRTASDCEYFEALGLASKIRERTGLPLDAYFSATKIRWLLANVPGARAAAERGELAFGTIDTFLLWRLTEGRVHATDATNASRTLLFDIQTQSWSDDLCEIFDIPKSLLPLVQPSSSYFGETTLFGKSIPIHGVAGDQHAATFGQATFKPGQVKNTYGTGCFLLMLTGDKIVRSTHGLLSTIGWQLNHQPVTYALEGSVFSAGAAVQWLHEELKIAASPQEVEALAQTVPDSDGVVMVPAFTGLGAPHWDPHARGTIVGLTRGSNRAHLCRAALDAIVYQTLDIVRAIEADSKTKLTEMRVDGGGSTSDFLMQLQADVLGIPVVRPTETETTARGVAFLAGLSLGLWGSTEEVGRLWKEQRRFEPRDTVRRADDWHRAIERAKDWERSS